MNIIEAIKSGKDFKRKSWDKRNYLYIDIGLVCDLIRYRSNNEYINNIPCENLIAEDWEIKE